MSYPNRAYEAVSLLVRGRVPPKDLMRSRVRYSKHTKFGQPTASRVRRARSKPLCSVRGLDLEHWRYGAAWQLVSTMRKAGGAVAASPSSPVARPLSSSHHQPFRPHHLAPTSSERRYLGAFGELPDVDSSDGVSQLAGHDLTAIVSRHFPEHSVGKPTQTGSWPRKR